MTAETWVIIWMGYAFLGPVTGFWPIPQLWDMLFTRKTLDKCHKPQISSAWGEITDCTWCGKSTNNWRHHPKRLEPHRFKAHVRRDVYGPETMGFCDLCNKRKGYKMHKLPLPISTHIQELEEWHLNFRKKHPEYEDSVRNEIFPELLDTE